MEKQENNKKSRIMEAAIQQYVQYGFENTSISQIADAAEVAKGTIYLYFSGKEQMIEQIFWHCHRMSVEASNQGLEEFDSAVDKLCKRAENAISWAMNHRKESQIERMYFSQPQYGHHARYQRQFLHFDTVDRIITDGILTGELKPLPSPLLGEMFYGVAEAMLHYLEACPELMEDKDFWQNCRKSIADCLKA